MPKPATICMTPSLENNNKDHFFELSHNEQQQLFEANENTSFNRSNLSGVNDWHDDIGLQFMQEVA